MHVIAHGVAVAPVLVLVLVAVAGCGGGDSGSAPAAPAPVFGANGAMAVDEFNAYLDGADEPWETSPRQVAVRFAHPVAQETERVASVVVPSSRDGTTIVVVTTTGLADDSIGGQRVAVSMKQNDDGTLRLTEAGWKQRCQTGRGHQDWSAEPCV